MLVTRPLAVDLAITVCSGIALGLLLVLLLAPPALAQCPGSNTPAFSVPEFRHGARMWTGQFGPATHGRIAPERDSTSFQGATEPGVHTGHPFYNDIAIVDNLAFVSYNYGFIVWDIAGARGPTPLRKLVCEGWDHGAGSCWHDPIALPTEASFFTTGIAATRHPSDTELILIVVSGDKDVGNTLWKYSKSLNKVTQLYQHVGPTGVTADVTQVGNSVYALVGTTNNGIVVYDLTAASSRETVCVEGNGCSYTPGHLGSGSITDIAVSGQAVWGTSMFSLPRLWSLNPTIPPSSTLRYTGSAGWSAPELFTYRGELYLSYVDATRTIKVHNASNCSLAGCASLPAPVATRVHYDGAFPKKHLTYSERLGRPFLYFGISQASLTLDVPRGELLMDLTGIDSGSPITLVGETERPGFETYTDACGHQGIGYWGDMYPGNQNGLNRVVGRTGLFNGTYFYRIAQLLFDVHKYLPPVTPPSDIFMDGFESGDTSAWS